MVRSALRSLTFFGKWFAEIVRQPGLMLSLIAGPFFILLTFGAGLSPTPPEPNVIIVADESWRTRGALTDEIRKHFSIVSTTLDLERARRMLRERRAEAVLVLPPDPGQSFERGERAEVLVLTNLIDPAKSNFTHTYLSNRVFALNRQMAQLMMRDAQKATQEMQASIDEAQHYTAQASAVNSPIDDELTELHQRLTRAAAQIDEFNRTSPEMVSAPFDLEVENIARFVPSYTAFYGPAVLVLLLQHLAITLGALTMTRIRLLGVMDLLRVSPVRPLEMAIGNYLSYTVLCAAAAVALIALLVYGLGVPLLGSLGLFATSLALLITSSLGIGFVIAALSSSEQQSAQVAMLVLLASIFFSALIFPLEQIAWPARAIAYVLPATYGIRSVQDIMLRGDLHSLADPVVLASASVALFFLTVALLRREWRPD